ncbi:MAG: 3-octaprenyl-4-hydroxybenzoate carboxy-lyase [Bacteroidetes bacterium HGW-Bacteroidetes-7]|nr:MAG: 3-octaprenyl-4-hydroxybenzoate carboxy-lyase [Bacteroidetes bacterium HGW-Bacteroidetes-7]
MKKILLGITGASGQIYASKMMEVVRAINGELSGKANGSESGVGSGNGSAAGMGIKLDLVFTDTAKVVWEDELGVPVPANALDNNSYYHPYASGSNAADIMIVMPCTMGTIGRIASGATSDLLTRAADVMLKERRPLIIVPRETPFNLIHLRNLTTLAEAGAIIAPASPSFYTHPQNMEELIDTFVRRILGIAGLEAHLKRFMSN